MLFKTKESMNQYTDVAASVTLLNVKSTAIFVESKILKSILGKSLYKELDDDFNENEDGLRSEQIELLEYCRRVLGPYICYYYAPKAAVQLSASGTQRVEGTNSKTSFAYQDVNFRAQYLLEGETACEALLEYLNENWANEPVWSDSSEFAEFKSLFIKTGSEFEKLYPTPQPYRNYWAMRFKMFEVEETHIIKAITSRLFNYLKQKDKSQDPGWSDAEKRLLLYLKKSIAYLTVAAAVPHLNVRIDDNGITIASDNSTVSNKDQKITKAADPASISLLITSSADAGKEWLKKAVDLLTEDPESFPEWINPLTTPKPKGNNNEKCGGGYALL